MLNLKDINWKKPGLFAAGVAFGTAGIKILTSDDAKKLYTNCTAAVLRAKSCVMKTATSVQENAGDILAEAKQINEDRVAEAEAEVVDDFCETEETAEDTAEAEATETAETEETKADAEPDKKGFFGKKKEKKDKKDEQIAELTDKVKRQLAEFENFRNRTEKEKSQMYMVGARDVIEKLLPVVDNFERGLKSIPEDQKDGPVASGMEMIYKQLITVLTDLGVTPIEAVGQEFDPNFHNAVMHAEDEELGENTVSEEFQKGYKYKDAVLRHSMVKVVN